VTYFDRNSERCSLDVMIRREPEWAAARIRVLTTDRDAAIARAERAEAEVERLNGLDSLRCAEIQRLHDRITADGEDWSAIRAEVARLEAEVAKAELRADLTATDEAFLRVKVADLTFDLCVERKRAEHAEAERDLAIERERLTVVRAAEAETRLRAAEVVVWGLATGGGWRVAVDGPSWMWRGPHAAPLAHCPRLTASPLADVTPEIVAAIAATPGCPVEVSHG
jgi:hypothetical protein